MSNRKRIFFTSDTHYFHANSIKFDNRPFRDVEHMHKVLINNYNSMVTENSVCYFLGDVGMGPSNKIKDVIDQLNGTKVLVLGNHDRGSNAMYNIGFDVVVNSASLVIAGKKVTMSHCPLRGIKVEDTSEMRGAMEGENWHGELRHVNCSVENEGQFHLHGHLHSPKEERIRDKQFDISVVGNNYYPVSISQVESWIVNYKRK